MRVYDDEGMALDLGSIVKVDKPQAIGAMWTFYLNNLSMDCGLPLSYGDGERVYKAWKQYVQFTKEG